VSLPDRDEPPLTQRKGTLAYLAPEVRLGLPHGQACDVWSFGILCLELAYCDGRTVERLDAIKKLSFPKSLLYAESDSVRREPMDSLLQLPLFRPEQGECEEPVFDEELLSIAKACCRVRADERISLVASMPSYFNSTADTHRSLLAAVTCACGFANSQGATTIGALAPASEFARLHRPKDP